MPIASYLAFPARDRFDELQRALDALPGCSTLPADGRELLVLVTDTRGPEEERSLQRRLCGIESLASLALVIARTDADAAPAPAAENGGGTC